MTARVYQLKVTLKDVAPPVWRRLLVADDTSLSELHEILQIVMGWQDSHLHAFTIHGQRFGVPDPDDFVPVVDERKHRVGLRVHAGHGFEYEYDFGDGWVHEVIVEAVRDATAGDKGAICVDGARACPPEDCGGPHGYGELLEALAKPRSRSPRLRQLREWIGGAFDAERFDLDGINGALARRRRRPSKRSPRRATRTLH